jgi:hypothetical protein
MLESLNPYDTACFYGFRFSGGELLAAAGRPEIVKPAADEVKQ